MENDELAHIGVLGMHWGRRKGSSKPTPTNSERAGARKSAVALAEQLSAVRRKRSFVTKVSDYMLSNPYGGKTFSESHGSSATAKKGSDLANKLEEVRRKRDKTTKTLDYLMTPGFSAKKFSEKKPSERRKITAITAAIIAGQVGLMVLASRK